MYFVERVILLLQMDLLSDYKRVCIRWFRLHPQLSCTIMAHMGPPPSPKEPRRSGRRSVPSASSSKSPAPSPVSESGPRSKDTRRTPSTSSSRSKRSKQEDLDDTPEEQPKIAPPPAPNVRNKRKGKDRDNQSIPSLDQNNTQKPAPAATEISDGAGGGPEEEVGVTRCVCGSAGQFHFSSLQL